MRRCSRPRITSRSAAWLFRETLFRVNNILAPLGVDERGGWRLQASLGRAVAALTGAPPPATMEDARHWGDAMQSRVSAFSRRLRTKHRQPQSDAARNRLAADQEQLYICPYGGTPERPVESVLHAPLQPQPSPPPPRATPPNPVPPSSTCSWGAPTPRLRRRGRRHTRPQQTLRVRRWSSSTPRSRPSRGGCGRT